jgi:DNA polymerase-4
MNIYTIGQLANCELDSAYGRFGVIGRMLWNFANGRDNTQIAYKDDRPDRKTDGNSTTALSDMRTLDDILEYSAKLCNLVSESLRTANEYCHGIKIGLRSAETLMWTGRQKKLPFPSRTSNMLYDHANILIQRHWDGEPLRGLEIRAFNLIDDEYLQMAILPEMLVDQKHERLGHAVQEIHRRMGQGILMPCRVYKNEGLRGMDLSSAESAQKNAFRRF